MPSEVFLDKRRELAITRLKLHRRYDGIDAKRDPVAAIVKLHCLGQACYEIGGARIGDDDDVGGIYRVRYQDLRNRVGCADSAAPRCARWASESFGFVRF